MNGNNDLPSDRHQSGRNSQQPNSDNRPVKSLTGGFSKTQKILRIVIILLILLMSYLLYDNYLGHGHTDYTVDNSPQFVGDQYYKNLNQGVASGVGTAGSGEGGEYITFGAGESSKKPRKDGKSGSGKRRPGREKGQNGSSKGNETPGVMDKVWNVFTYPFRKFRDCGRYLANMAKGSPEKAKEAKKPNIRKNDRRKKQKDKFGEGLDGMSESSEPGALRDLVSNPDQQDKTTSNDSELQAGEETSMVIPGDDALDLDNETPAQVEKPRTDRGRGGDKPSRDSDKRNRNRNKEQNNGRQDYGRDSIDQRYGQPDSMSEESMKKMKFSVPKSDIRLPNMKDIRTNPKKYGVKTRIDPAVIDEPSDMGLGEDDKENQEMSDLFGEDKEDQEDQGSLGHSSDDLGLGEIDGLKLLLDPSFLGKVKNMVRDLMGSSKNLKKNRELLKKFKHEMEKNQSLRNKCKSRVEQLRVDLAADKETRRQKEKLMRDLEREKKEIDEKIRREEETYMRGEQKTLNKKIQDLKSGIIELNGVIRNERPYLEEIETKKSQGDGLRLRIEVLKQKIASEQDNNSRHVDNIKSKKVLVAKAQKMLRIDNIKYRGFRESLKVKEDNMKLRDLVKEMSDKTNTISDQLDSIYEDKTISKKEMEKILIELREFDSDISIGDFDDEKDKYDALRGSLEEMQIKAKKIDFVGIENDIKKLNKKIEELLVSRKENKSKIDRYSRQIEEFKNSVERTNAQLNRLIEELARLEAQLQKCEQYVENKTNDMKNVKQQKAANESQQEDLEENLKKIKDEHVNRRRSLEGQKNELVKRIRDLQEQLLRLARRIKDKNKRFQKKLRECRAYQAYAREARNRAKLIKKKFKGFEDTIKKLKRDIKGQMRPIYSFASDK